MFTFFKSPKCCAEHVQGSFDNLSENFSMGVQKIFFHKQKKNERKIFTPKFFLATANAVLATMLKKLRS